jgi:peptidoglycan/LPS O-acetylase OafA/YrhL
MPTVIANEFISLITVFIIFAQITRTNFIFDLDNKILDFIGKISFGIYVIHPLIILLSIKLIGKFQNSSIFNYLFVYSFIITLTILFSYLSYALYEKKFILMKSNFTLIKNRA